MAPNTVVYNQLKNVSKGTMLKIIYDAGSKPGSTRYAKFQSVWIPPMIFKNSNEGYLDIMDNGVYKSLLINKIFLVEIMSEDKKIEKQSSQLETKFNVSLKKNMALRFIYNKHPQTYHYTELPYRQMTFISFIQGETKDYIRCSENGQYKLLITRKIHNLSIIDSPLKYETLNECDEKSFQNTINKQKILINELKNSLISVRKLNLEQSQKFDCLELEFNNFIDWTL